MKTQMVLFKEANALITAAKYLDDSLDDIAKMLAGYSQTGKHAVVTGIGKNADIAKKIAATWSSIGIPSFYLDAYHALHGDLGSITKDQVVFAISKSGKTEEMLQTLKALGEKGVVIVSITCSLNSPQGKIAKEYNGLDIYVPCFSEADELDLAPTNSSTLLLAVGDSIGVVASSLLNFTKKDFLDRHPAGNLGKTLQKDLG